MVFSRFTIETGEIVEIYYFVYIRHIICIRTMYNTWCFFNTSSRFLERESHQQKDFPMEKDSEQLQIDQPRKLCCLFYQQNQIQPMMWMMS